MITRRQFLTTSLLGILGLALCSTENTLEKNRNSNSNKNRNKRGRGRNSKRRTIKTSGIVKELGDPDEFLERSKTIREQHERAMAAWKTSQNM